MPLFYLIVLSLLTLPVLANTSCGDPATAIARVQGNTGTSPLAGQWLTIEGIVTLDSRGKDGFQGLYLQQADDRADGNPDTSDALFVYTRSAVGSTGHRLRVSGQVQEYHGLTELTHTRDLIDCGAAALPAAEAVSLPWPDDRRPEQLEAMRVTLEQPLTIVDSYQLARFGVLALAGHDAFVPTQLQPPSPAVGASAPDTLLLDDGKRNLNPKPLPYPPGGLGGQLTVRAGDRLVGLDAILDWRYGNWHLQPRSQPTIEAHNPRRPVPPRPEAATVRVAAMNLENAFNGNGQGDGFPTARGARSAAAYARQKARLQATLSALGADIIVLVELENDGYDAASSLAEITRSLGSSWRFVHPDGGDGHDAIRVGIIYNEAAIQPVGTPERITDGSFSRGSRPPLAQTFRTRSGSNPLRVVATHLKSKRCQGARGKNLDQGDGQGCFVAARVQAAHQLAEWLSGRPVTPGLAGTLIAGDFNSYAREDPLSEFARAGFTDLVRHFHGLDNHSFRFRGQAGTLDYGLASTGLLPRIQDARIWAVNSDEPRALGYQSARIPLSGSDQYPWRSSDHDPVIVDIAL